MDKIYKEATFSSNRKYRYLLKRYWDKRKPQVVFIGINPSTADENKDDATIRRLCYFANSWGFGGFSIINLFSLVSRDQQALNRVSYNEAVGGRNAEFLHEECLGSTVVLMWGDAKTIHLSRRVNYYLEVLDDLEIDLFAFKLTSRGNPAHPLYLPGDTKLKQISWEERKLFYFDKSE